MTGSRKQKEEERTTLIAFVLDKSGSMDGIRDATISGFNEFKHDQERVPGKALMSLTFFDTSFRSVCGPVPISEVRDLDRESYEPGGCTALYDAIANTIRDVDSFVARRDRRPDSVLVVIMTDGQENSSREYDRDRIFRMIQERQDEYGYEFVYLGADQDSYAVGTSIGVREGRHLNFIADERGQHRAFERLSQATADFRVASAECQSSCLEMRPDELLEERDAENRGTPPAGR